MGSYNFSKRGIFSELKEYALWILLLLVIALIWNLFNPQQRNLRKLEQEINRNPQEYI
jgi:hypothetical protein